MRTRLKTLERLTALYKVVEHAHGISLDQARAALNDLETALRERAAQTARLSEAARDALRRGDLQEWLIDQAQVEFTEWNSAATGELRQRREQAMRDAAELYQASRMQLEQMQSVLGEVRAGLAREQARSEQRVADDRYLSRQRWQEQDEVRRDADEKRPAATWFSQTGAGDG